MVRRESSSGTLTEPHSGIAASYVPFAFCQTWERTSPPSKPMGRRLERTTFHALVRHQFYESPIFDTKKFCEVTNLCCAFSKTPTTKTVSLEILPDHEQKYPPSVHELTPCRQLHCPENAVPKSITLCLSRELI